MAIYSLSRFLQQQRYAKKALNRAVEPLYAQAQIPASQFFTDTEFLVVDCEMSGLNVMQDQILSIGWVTIRGNRIVNASRRYYLIHAEKGTGETTRIHGLMESSIAGAASIASVLMILIKQMQNKVLVFHHAPLDLAFLQRASLHHFQCPLLFSYLDTLEIERRRLHLRNQTGGLRLAQCRERYSLTSGNQHNALADAFATAELLLAQASYIGDTDKLPLSYLGIKSTCHLRKAR